ALLLRRPRVDCRTALQSSSAGNIQGHRGHGATQYSESLRGPSVLCGLAFILVCSLVTGSPEAAQTATRVVRAVRLPQNPLITINSSKTLGDNVNGPSIIRVPSWIEHPLGRYYMYFAHHMGTHIRLAYADAITGPWHVYDPGVLEVKDTAFYRPQPD